VSGASVVYFVQAGDAGPIKIGTTDDLRTRVAALQTAHYEELRLLGTTPGGPAIERAWHGRFGDDRLRGEWFRPSVALVLAIQDAVGVTVGRPNVSEAEHSARWRVAWNGAVDAHVAGDASAYERHAAEIRLLTRMRARQQAAKTSGAA
jgi:hypothetical protein